MINVVKLIIYVLLATLISCNPASIDKASNNNDSIKKYIKLASIDTLSFKQRNSYNKKAFDLIDLTKNDTITRFYLSETTFNYLRLKNWDALNKTNKILLQKATEEKDTLGLARHFRYKSGYYRNIQNNDSAFYYNFKAEKYYKKLNRFTELGIVLLNKSIIQFSQNDFLAAQYSGIKAYKFLEKSNNFQNQYRVLNHLGIVSVELKENNVGIKFIEKALKFAVLHKIDTKDKEEATCLNNIGTAYIEQKNYIKAIEYFKLALKDSTLFISAPDMYEILISNIGYCELKLKKYNQLPDVFYKALKISDSLKIKERNIANYIHLSVYYEIKKDTSKAKFFASKALLTAKKIKAPYYVEFALQQLIKVDKINASKNAEHYIVLKDSLVEAERGFRNKFARIEFETDQIQQEKDLVIKQKGIIIAFTSVVFIIGLLLFVLTNQRSKHKELLLLQSQQKANEDIYQLMLSQKAKEEAIRLSEKIE